MDTKPTATFISIAVALARERSNTLCFNRVKKRQFDDPVLGTLTLGRHDGEEMK